MKHKRQLPYETYKGLLMKKDGQYSYQCDLCRLSGKSRKILKVCPRCKGDEDWAKDYKERKKREYEETVRTSTAMWFDWGGEPFPVSISHIQTVWLDPDWFGIDYDLNERYVKASNNTDFELDVLTELILDQYVRYRSFGFGSKQHHLFEVASGDGSMETLREVLAAKFPTGGEDQTVEIIQSNCASWKASAREAADRDWYSNPPNFRSAPTKMAREWSVFWRKRERDFKAKSRR